MKQIIEQENNKIILTNTIDLDPLLEDNYLRRMDNPSGMSKERNFRAVASIPKAVLENDIDGLAFLNAIPGTKEERMALTRFLGKYPEYKTSEGRI